MFGGGLLPNLPDGTIVIKGKNLKTSAVWNILLAIVVVFLIITIVILLLITDDNRGWLVGLTAVAGFIAGLLIQHVIELKRLGKLSISQGIPEKTE